MWLGMNILGGKTKCHDKVIKVPRPDILCIIYTNMERLSFTIVYYIFGWPKICTPQNIKIHETGEKKNNWTIQRGGETGQTRRERVHWRVQKRNASNKIRPPKNDKIWPISRIRMAKQQFLFIS